MLLENNPYRIDQRPQHEARTLLEAGYQISVICPGRPGGKMYEVVDGVRLYQFPPLPATPGFWGYATEYAYAGAVMSLLSLIVLARGGFDILHAHNPPDIFFLVGAFYKLLGKRFVFDHHDLAPEVYSARFGRRSNPLVYQAVVLLEKLTCRVADRVIATNASYAAVERVRDHVPADRITIVRNGPLQESLQWVEPEPSLRCRADTILGYVGRMGPQDGVDYLLRALQHLIRDLGRTDCFCALIGAGDALSGLQALAAHLRLTDYVLFTGWVPPAKVARYLSATDICVTPDPSNPYNDRSTMVKLMDYMARAKPIVAFDLPEHRVTAGGAAVYVRPNDELEFARQIAALMDDPERRKEMGRIGRDRIRNELAWIHQQKCLLEAYQALAGPRRQALAASKELQCNEPDSSRGCLLHSLPRLSEPMLEAEAQPLRSRFKLALKRGMSDRAKRTLKTALAGYTAWLSHLAGRSNAPSAPIAELVLSRLQAGDLVLVRPRAEIEETLDIWHELKHCRFMDEMWPYCGTTQKVRKRVERFVDERDYQVKEARGIVLLEGVNCQGTELFGRCDRSCFFFWREEWLDKID